MSELLTLDELTTAVENAFDCAAIEVQVWETDTTGARTIESPHPMYRLTRCLRSYGLLDERRDPDEDAGDDITESWTEWLTVGTDEDGDEGAETFETEVDAVTAAGRWRIRGMTNVYVERHDVATTRTVSTTTRTTAWKADER